MRRLCILLAGGKSSRSSQLKGLRKIAHHYFLEELIEAYSNISEIHVAVLLANSASRYLESIPLLQKARSEIVTINQAQIYCWVHPNPSEDAFSSIQFALENAQKFQAEKICIHPVDFPFAGINDIEKLFLETGDLVKAQYQGKSGHPILISDKLAQRLIQWKFTNGENRLDKILREMQDISRAYVAFQSSAILVNLNDDHAWNNYIKSLSV